LTATGSHAGEQAPQDEQACQAIENIPVIFHRMGLHKKLKTAWRRSIQRQIRGPHLHQTDPQTFTIDTDEPLCKGKPWQDQANRRTHYISPSNQFYRGARQRK
jgi:hypothetical protein